MEYMNIIFGKYLTIAFAALFVLAGCALGMCFALRSRMNELQKKYDFFTQGKEANIDVVLTNTLNDLHNVRTELKSLQDQHAKLHDQVQNCLQNVKMVRYDAFDAMGGELSYSVMITDANNKGIILTSLYGREESRCFAKDIDNGKSSYVLADEEKQLL